MPRRRRHLTDAERALWNTVAETTTRLSPEPAPAGAETAPSGIESPSPQKPPKPPRIPRPQVKPQLPSQPRSAPVKVDLVPDPMAVLDRPAPGMDRKRFNTLRKGKLTPDATLDLHGMTADRAKAVLTGFVMRAHSSDQRLVLVITGKGRPGADPMAPHRVGILRHAVPQWLNMPPLAGLILQVTPAHRSHGGTGAYYVYLRRNR